MRYIDKEDLALAANAALAKLCELDGNSALTLDTVPDWSDLVVNSREDFLEIISAAIGVVRVQL